MFMLSLCASFKTASSAIQSWPIHKRVIKVPPIEPGGVSAQKPRQARRQIGPGRFDHPMNVINRPFLFQTQLSWPHSRVSAAR